MMTGRHTWMPAIHVPSLQLTCMSVCPFRYRSVLLLMDDRAQWRNATLVAACAVLVTAASYWTGRSAVLLAGALHAGPLAYVRPTPSQAQLPTVSEMARACRRARRLRRRSWSRPRHGSAQRARPQQRQSAPWSGPRLESCILRSRAAEPQSVGEAAAAGDVRRGPPAQGCRSAGSVRSSLQLLLRICWGSRAVTPC